MPGVLDFQKPHVLRDNDEYEAAIARIDELLRADVAEDTEEGDELLFLSVLVEEYEHREYPIKAASPQDLVDFMLEQRGLTRADLADVMGGRSRVSDFFAGKRELSKHQAIALGNLLRIPLDALLRE